MSKDTGGPAFPFSFNVGDDHRWAHGLTLRDYFAAKAMQAVFSQIFMASQASGTTPEKLAELKATGAYICYSMADAMLKAREQ